MTNKHLSREYLFGYAIPLGFRRNGQRPISIAHEDDHPSKFYSQNFRRGHVQLYFAILVTYLAISFSSLSQVYILVSAALLALPMILIRISIYSINDLPSNAIDERERTLSEQAFTLAYKFLFLLVILATALIAGFSIKPSNHDLISIGVALISLIYILPSAIIAWTQEL